MERGEGHKHEIVELEGILERNLCFQTQHFMACLHNEVRKQSVLKELIRGEEEARALNSSSTPSS